MVTLPTISGVKVDPDHNLKVSPPGLHRGSTYEPGFQIQLDVEVADYVECRSYFIVCIIF